MTDLKQCADTRADLGVFHDPRSVAVVGASANPAKWGYWLARGALAGRSRRRVYLVNSRGGEILGVPAATALGDLAEVPELVAFCVPPQQVWRVADEALALGVRGLLGITAEVPRADELAARVTAAGARLVGPSSLGLFDAATSLQLAWGNFVPGALAIVSQSGQLGSEIALLAERAGIGVSRFVSAGSQLDVTIADLLNDLAGHERTRAVAVYLEDFTDGRRIFDAIAALRAAGKPVVLLTAGGSAAGRRAARSHTGALTSPLEFIDAACRAAGALRAQTPAELVHIVAYLLASALPTGTGRGQATVPTGPRVGVVSDSGGQGVVAADCLSRHGLAVPELTGVRPALAAKLPAAAATGNPVDLAGAGEHDLGCYPDVTAALLESGEVDSVLLTGYFGRYGLDSPTLQAAEQEIAGQLGTLARRTGRPLVVHSMGADSATATALRGAGVPVYGTVEAATEALSATVALGHRPVRPTGARTAQAPQPAGRAGRIGGPAESAAGYWAARKLLQEAGIAFPAARQVSDQRAIVCRELFFTDVFVPEENRLGAEGQGFHGLMRTFDISRIVLGAAAVGAARAAYEYARDYARTRVQFGKAIIEHQAVAFRLADMASRIEASRLLVLRAARAIDAGEPATGLAAIAKLTASETAMFCTWAAVQTLGGWGYSREYPVEKWMRDAKLEEIEEGTSDIMRMVIARHLP